MLPQSQPDQVLLEAKEGLLLYELQKSVEEAESVKFRAMVEKLSTASIDKVIGNSDFFSEAIWSQDEAAFTKLVKKASPDVLVQALTVGKKASHLPLFILSRQQSHESVRVLLEKIRPSAETLNAYFKKHPKRFFTVLEEHALYQSPQNIVNFLNLFDEAFLSEMASQLPKRMERLKKFYCWLAFNEKMNGLHPLPVEFKEEPEKKQIEEAKEKSPTNFLKQVKVWQKPIQEKLQVENKEFKNISEIKTVQELSPEERQLLTCFHGGQAGIKIVTEDEYKDFTWLRFADNVQTYARRQKLRKKNKPLQGYKYFHVPPEPIKQGLFEEAKKEVKNDSEIVYPKGKIVPYQKVHNPQKKYDATTKTSFTIISSQFTTTLFGPEDPARQVGIVADSSQCEMNLMLTQDRGTFNRNWLSDKLWQVIKYAETIQHVSYTDRREYRAAIDAQPYTMNEVFLKVKREALTGIIVASKTPATVKLALKRQKDLKFFFKPGVWEFNRVRDEKEEKRIVPIIFYNPVLKKVWFEKDLPEYVLLHETKEAIAKLTPKEDRHRVLQNAIFELKEGSHREQLQMLYVLLNAYLTAATKKDLFYAPLIKLYQENLKDHSPKFVATHDRACALGIKSATQYVATEHYQSAPGILGGFFKRRTTTSHLVDYAEPYQTALEKGIDGLTTSFKI